MPSPLVSTGPRARWAPGVLFAGVFILPVLGWLSYNWWDQPLESGVETVLEAVAEPVPDSENLFLALLAFPISGEDTAHERGASALAAYSAAVEGNPGRAAPKTYAAALDRYSARFDEKGLSLCSAGHQEGAYACLRNSLAQRTELEAFMQPLRPLLLRYRELEAYPRYSDPRPAALDEPAPDSAAYRIALLNLSGLAWMVQAGAVDEAVASLERSAAIWRRVLAAREVTLIDKMLASRAFAAHLLFASELIRSLPILEVPSLAAIERLTSPLSDAERSLAGALERELRVQARMWEQVADGSNPRLRADVPGASAWWYRFMIKKNDSLNRAYRDLDRVLAAERAGCTEVRSQLEAAMVRGESDTELPWYAYFYNPVGRVMQAMGADATRDLEYLGRQCNLLALQRMVGLQLELKRLGAGPEVTAAQVQALASSFSDPNSGRPFVYDADKQTLGFEFIGAKKEFVTPMPLEAPLTSTQGSSPGTVP